MADHEECPEAAAFAAANHRDEHRLFRPPVQLRPATGEHGADLWLPGRRRSDDAALVARRPDDGPDHPADYRGDERSHQFAVRQAHALLPRGRDHLHAQPVPDALLKHAMDGRIAAVDPRCRQQHHDGTLPRLCGGSAGARAAVNRLPDAKRLHRPCADLVLSCPDIADGLRRAGRARCQRHSGDRADRFHHRRHPVDFHHRLVGLAGAGTAAHRG